MASAPAMTTARASRMPTVAPARAPRGRRVITTPARPPAVATRTAARGIDEGHRHGAGAEDREGDRRRIPARPGRQPDDRQPRARRPTRARGTGAGTASSPGRRHRSRRSARDRSRSRQRPRRPARPGRSRRRRVPVDGPRPRLPRTRTRAPRRGSGSSRWLGLGLRRRRASAGSATWLGRCGVVALISKVPGPSARAAAARIATAPPRVATRPAVRTCSRGSGVPPRPVRTRSVPVNRRASPSPTRRMSRPVTSGTTARAASANPAAEASSGPAAAAPSPWLPYPAAAAASARKASVGQPISEPRGRARCGRGRRSTARSRPAPRRRAVRRGRAARRPARR